MNREVGVAAGFIVTVVMSIIVAGVMLVNINTNTLLSSNTAHVTAVSNIALVAFTILAVGIIAMVGKYIIDIFT